MTHAAEDLLLTPLFHLDDGREVLRDEPTGTLHVRRVEHSTAPTPTRGSGLLAPLREAFHALQASVLVESPSPWRVRLVRLVLPVPRLPRRGRFLDVGCGTGGVLGRLPEGWERSGVEPDAGRAAIAGRIPGVTVWAGRLEEFESSRTFDCIRACHVIEHTGTPDAFLDAIATHLAEDGRAVLYTPNAGGLAFRLSGRHWSCFADPTHVRLFTLDGLAARCEAHGLVVLERGTYEMGIAAESLLRACGMQSGSRWSLVAQVALTALLAPLLWLASRAQLGDACYVVATKRRASEPATTEPAQTTSAMPAASDTARPA